MKGLFVTGTDTAVGKTTIAAAIVQRLAQRGQRVLAFKPIETGCAPGTLGPDQRALVRAAGGWQTGTACGVYQLRMPAAPLVSARAEHTTIDFDHILRIANELRADVRVVEGAGGWRVPITDTADMSALARAFGHPVLIVARAGLGTINHSLLTIEAVERDGCEVAGLVLSHRPEDDPGFTESNAAEIRARWPKTVVIYAGDPSVLDRFT
jgi:dethiobiotin synthetase